MEQARPITSALLPIDETRQSLESLNYRQLTQIEKILIGDFVPLADFAKAAWPIVEPGRPYRHNWHIDAIADHLSAAIQLQIKSLIISMPPRHMKSLMVSVFFPTWAWSWLPELRFIFASYSQDLAIRDAVKSRRIIQSTWYRSLWGSSFSLTGDQNVKSRYENDHAGFRVSTSVGGMATGEGGDVIIVDDPHNVKQVESEKSRQGVIRWWDLSMQTRVNDPAETVRIVMAQRSHVDDLTGHILEQMQDGGRQYEHLCLPAEYEPKYMIETGIGFRDPRAKAGDLLWPDRFPAEEIATIKKALGPYGSAAQLQQRPAPIGGGMFKRIWWRFWQLPGQALGPVIVDLPDGETFACPVRIRPAAWDQVAQSWDFTFKKTTAGSFVCGQVWARHGADRFLLAQERARMDFLETIAAVRRMSNQWPDARAKWIEEKANGDAVVSTLRQEIAGLLFYNPTSDKVSRAVSVTPQIASGNVYLPHPTNAPWIRDWIDRFAQFPNGPNDEIDTTSQILNIWAPAMKRTWGRR